MWAYFANSKVFERGKSVVTVHLFSFCPHPHGVLQMRLNKTHGICAVIKGIGRGRKLQTAGHTIFMEGAFHPYSWQKWQENL